MEIVFCCCQPARAASNLDLRESHHGRLSISRLNYKNTFLCVLVSWGRVQFTFMFFILLELYQITLILQLLELLPYINVRGEWASAGDAVGLLLALLRGQRMIRQPLPTKITILSYSESGKTTSLVFPTWWRKGMTGKCIFLTMSVISLTINFSQLC